MRASRNATLASVMAGCLEPLGLSGTLLSALDETGLVAEAATQLGMRASVWQRSGGSDAEPWPREELVDHVALRLPKGRKALEMSLHAVLARLAPGGRLFLYGANDEGVRSTQGLLEELLEQVHTLETKRHCRVWSGERSTDAGALWGSLEDWAEELSLEAPGGALRLRSYPGLFAHGRLDAGTRALLEALENGPRPKPRGRLLDFGCGAGTIGIALQRRVPEAELHGVDRDALAVHAARENLPGATVHLGAGWKAIPRELRFDLIASNPPLHEGKDVDLGGFHDLLDGSGRHLTRRGRLVLVTGRPIPAGALLRDRFAQVSLLHETPSYRVWSATQPSRS